MWFPYFIYEQTYNKLKHVKKTINFGYKEGNKFYIGVTKYGVQWVKDNNKCKITLNMTYLELAINFLFQGSSLRETRRGGGGAKAAKVAFQILVKSFVFIAAL